MNEKIESLCKLIEAQQREGHISQALADEVTL